MLKKQPGFALKKIKDSFIKFIYVSNLFYYNS